MEKSDKIKLELEKIAQKNGGQISPAQVVAFARNPKTALHSQFTWDDTKAAEEHRLWQARQVLRCFVTVIHEDKPPVRLTVSLLQDRDYKHGGGGYRYTKDVLESPEHRAAIIAQFYAEARALMKRYSHIKELAAIFDTIERQMELFQKKSKRARVSATAPPPV